MNKEENVIYDEYEVLELDEYQEKSQVTNKYIPGHENIVCCTLGLASEGGEVAGKVDKSIRKTHGTDFTEEQKLEIIKEIGDALWFAAGLSKALGYKLSQVASINLKKLADREKRDVICGSGDNR